MFSPQKIGETTELTGVTYTWCDFNVDLTDLKIEFYVGYGSVRGLDWVTIDKATNRIKVEATAEAFATYNQQTI